MKNKKRFIEKIIICSGCVVIIATILTIVVLYLKGSLIKAKPAESKGGKYIMTYYTGDGEEDEQISIAASEDGYNFTALNNGEPIVAQTLGTLGARDPFIIRGNDGFFYLIASDMKMKNGDESNHAFITWKSADLVTWSDETNIELRNFASFESCNRAWSPKAIYDEKEKKYMVYFSASTLSDDMKTPQLYYSYTTDFKKFTVPKSLYNVEGHAITSAYIIYNSAVSKYNLYYTLEDEKLIYVVPSSTLIGSYSAQPFSITNRSDLSIPCVHNITGTDTYVISLFSEKDNESVMIQTDDFREYRFLKSGMYSFPNNARAGSVMPITDEEYDMLVAAYGFEEDSSNRLITPFSTTDESNE